MTDVADGLRAWPPQERKRRSVGGCLRGLLAQFSIAAPMLFAAPGIAVLVGTRAAIARLLRRDIRHRDWFLALGGRPYLNRFPHRWRGVAFGLVPSAILALVGAGLLWPTFVDLQVLGISPIPSASANPRLLVGEEAEATGFQLFAVSGTAGGLRIWVGAACWYCAAPDRGVLTTMRRELAEVDSFRLGAHALRLALVPMMALRGLATVIDEAALWFGLNLFIGAGGISLLTLALLEAGLVRVVY